MKLTPLDIHHKEFRRAIRGYNEEDVDVFLDEVAEEFERLFKENIEFKEQLEKTKEKIQQYEGIEDTLQKTLLTAQKSAEEVKAKAGKEAELIIKDAELKARETLQGVIKERERLQISFNELKRAEEDFRKKLRSLLESFLTMLNEIEGGMGAKKEPKGEAKIEEQPKEETEAQLTRLIEEIKIAKGEIMKDKADEDISSRTATPEAEEEVVREEEIAEEVAEEHEEETAEKKSRVRKRGIFGKKKKMESDIEEIS